MEHFMIAKSSWLLLVFFSWLLADCCSQLVVIHDPYIADELDCPSPDDRSLEGAWDRGVLWGDPDRAYKTLPPGLAIAPSRIPNAGNGVFSNIFIKKFTWLGEYEGEVISYDKDNETSPYAWLVNRGGKYSHFIDAYNIETSSCWHFMNCARNISELNVEVYECRGKIFFMTCRDIAPGDEFLVYYGDQYAETLGIEPFED